MQSHHWTFAYLIFLDWNGLPSLIHQTSQASDLSLNVPSSRKPSLLTLSQKIQAHALPAPVPHPSQYVSLWIVTIYLFTSSNILWAPFRAGREDAYLVHLGNLAIAPSVVQRRWSVRIHRVNKQTSKNRKNGQGDCIAVTSVIGNSLNLFCQWFHP